MEKEIGQIAARIRRWRAESGLTLQELGQRSRVSASTIHKIENQQTVPTISVLLRVAHGLKRRPGELLADRDEDGDIALLPLAERLSMESGSGTRAERLASDLTGSTLDVWRVIHPPGTQSGSETGHRPMSYKGELIIVCEEGVLTIDAGDQKYQLSPGDSLHLKTTLPHRWRNDADVPAVALFFGTVPAGLHQGLEERMRSLRGGDDDDTEKSHDAG